MRVLRNAIAPPKPAPPYLPTLCHAQGSGGGERCRHVQPHQRLWSDGGAAERHVPRAGWQRRRVRLAQASLGMGGDEGVAGGQPGEACRVLDGSASGGPGCSGVWSSTQEMVARVGNESGVCLATHLVGCTVTVANMHARCPLWCRGQDQGGCGACQPGERDCRAGGRPGPRPVRGTRGGASRGVHKQVLQGECIAM